MCILTTNFKTKILKWLTGNYNVETGTEGIGQTDYTIENVTPLYTVISNELNTLFPGETIAEPHICNSENITNKNCTIVFGTVGAVGDTKGYIMLLDKQNNIIKTITEYSSGTQFKGICSMGVAEDGTFFIVEDTYTTYRFVMLNNIVAKLPDEDYQAILRKAYTFPEVYFDMYYNIYPQIIKSPQNSVYLITARNISTNQDNETKNVAVELKVNVGISNEWNKYSINVTKNDFIIIKKPYAEWDIDGNLSFKLAGFVDRDKTGSHAYYYYEIKNINGTQTSNDFFSINGDEFIVDDMDVCMTGINNTYIGYYEDAGTNALGWNMVDFYIGYMDYDNNLFNQLYSDNIRKLSNSIYLYSISNEIMFYTTKYDSPDNYVSTGISIGRIINNTVYIKDILSITQSISPYPLFTVSKAFNLYTYSNQMTNSAIIINEVYNDNNYNGTDYQDYNSMSPNSEISYDTNNKMVFARNLYNKLVQGNTTTSVVQIPYNYANNIQIDNNYIYGETNTNLLQDDTSFTKNIYEEVMLNFINMVTMQNKNDPDNITKNITGATKLNQSISDLLDYNNTKATKIRINYTDNTSKTTTISSSVNSLTATYNFVVYIDKAINTIDIISNDETTTYCSIDASNYEVGKYYKITQEVIIN